MLISNPSCYTNSFYNIVPKSIIWPMIILSTVATVIASQAVISGTFSLISQAVSLGFFPPIRIHHTSAKIMGQIYVPGTFFFEPIQNNIF